MPSAEEEGPHLTRLEVVSSPEGPCIHIVYTWALKYLNRDYIKAKV